MRLPSSDGAEVGLRLVRYQFGTAGPAVGEDANWLVVHGDVKTADGRRWSFDDPCLTTREAGELGRWIRGVLAGEVEPSTFSGSNYGQLLYFTEPNLAFSLDGTVEDRARIRVHLSLEALPLWIDPSSRLDFFEFFVLLDIGRDELARAADEWSNELAAYPER